MNVKEHKFKVIMLGAFAVGKTSLIKRYVYDLFDDNYLTTIGVKVVKKELEFESGGTLYKITVLLWDIAETEDYDKIPRGYLEGSSGTILVSDITRRETIDKMIDMGKTLSSSNLAGSLIQVYNKTDLIERNSGAFKTLLEKIAATAAETGIPFFLTSAKEGSGVEEMFLSLIKNIIEKKA